MTIDKSMKERKRLKKLLEKVSKQIREATDSTYWSYTKEYSMGMLNSAQILIDKVVERLDW